MTVHSQRSREGTLLIDHRNSPGVKASDIGGCMAPGVDTKFFESATFTCPHCHRQCVVVRKRSARKASPNWCSKCDRRVCDNVACNIHCRNMNRLLDRLLDRAFRFVGREDNPESRRVFITDGA